MQAALLFDGLDAKAWLFFGSVGGDDHVLDAVVGLLRDDAADGELIFGGVRAAVDDALGVDVADAGKGFELVGCGGVDVEEAGSGGGGFGRLSEGAGHGSEGGNDDEKERGGEKSATKM